MTSLKSQMRDKTWMKDRYLISTDPELIPIPKLVQVFASEEFYWAKTLPVSVMQETLRDSLVFGLYDTNAGAGTSTDAELKFETISDQTNSTQPSNKLTGFARCITDFTTFLYLTDVWVDPASQGNGLGKWLFSCIQEVIEDMPYLRRSMLFTRDWERSVPFYERLMGMKVVAGRQGEGFAVMERMGKGHPNFRDE